MRRPSLTNLRRLARAEAVRREPEDSAPFIPILVRSRQELAELNAFFGFPPTYNGPLPGNDFPDPDHNGAVTVPHLLRYLKEKSCT
jgi:hypothetical protein